jgi:5-methylcytosine-specific restriction enzyme A
VISRPNTFGQIAYILFDLVSFLVGQFDGFLHRTADAFAMSEGRWHKWYDLPRWRRRRRSQLLHHPWCVICESRGIATIATIADHVVPHRGDWNAFIFGDLQSLCRAHHDGSKKEMELKGYCTDIGIDGWPLDSKHPANTGRILSMKTDSNPSDVSINDLKIHRFIG